MPSLGHSLRTLSSDFRVKLSNRGAKNDSSHAANDDGVLRIQTGASSRLVADQTPSPEIATPELTSSITIEPETPVTPASPARPLPSRRSVVERYRDERDPVPAYEPFVRPPSYHEEAPQSIQEIVEEVQTVALVETRQIGSRDETSTASRVGDVAESASNQPLPAPPTTSKPLDHLLAKVPAEIWNMVAEYCDAATMANLAYASPDLAYLIGSCYWKQLSKQENHQDKIRFLSRLDSKLPGHLLCFVCATFHARTYQNEHLTQSFLSSPVYECPSLKSKISPPKCRLTFDRDLPYALIQLAMRPHHYSDDYGISLKAISKKWTCRRSGWEHATRFQIIDGHLLMRVISTVSVAPEMLPSDMRGVLFDRTNLMPYFSTCHHWTHEGTLTALCKCALKHIQPAHRDRLWVPSGSCADCRPLRRCYNCPTEYLIQVSRRQENDHFGKPGFGHVLTVTRWSDLGDGLDATLNREWLACKDDGSYDEMVRNGDLDGHKTLRRKFEGKLGNRVPEARALPLRKRHAWQSKNARLWTEEERWNHEQREIESGRYVGYGSRADVLRRLGLTENGRVIASSSKA